MEDLCTYNHPDPNTPGRVIPINFCKHDVEALIKGIAEAAGLRITVMLDTERRIPRVPGVSIPIVAGDLPPIADATDPIPGEVTATFRPVTPTPEPPKKPKGK